MALKPYYSHAGIAIYHGRAEEVLPQVEAGRLVLTDPPYNAINRETGGLRTIQKGDADSEFVDIPLMAREIERVCSGTGYVWCSDDQFSHWVREFKSLGLTTRSGAWRKTDPSPMNGQRLWLSAIELCVFFRKGGATFNRHCKAALWEGPIAAPTGHPTPKPEWLFAELIDASTLEGDTVIDPYMGAGTSLAVAKRLGRNGIGIDKEECWCEIAAKRLCQDSLFAEVN